jgi:large subunit ribosomal protein L10
MSKYVKEMMMDQFRSDLGGATSVLILDFKGLDAVSEHRLRMDLRKKKIKIRALRNTLARRVFDEVGLGGLSGYLTGPSVAAWGGDGPAELAKEISAQVKKLKKPAIKGGAVDGVIVGPDQVEEITKLPSREALIGQVLGLLLSPPQQVLSMVSSPASTLIGQLEAFIKKQEGEAGGGEGEAGTTGDAEPTEDAGDAPAAPG